MIYIDAIILGFTQGLTEFLPISSSGHLLIVRDMLNLPLAGTLTFDAILQWATVLAVVLYFAKDLWRVMLSVFRLLLGKQVDYKEKVYVGAIALGTIPAVVFGVLLESTMDTVFRNIDLVALALLVGSMLMYSAQKYAERVSPMSNIGETQGLTIRKGFIIGFFQSLALVPGVSRSGATISGGLFAGLSREEATRFSFLLSVPILVGSGLKKLLEVDFTASGGLFGPLFIGSLVSFVVGLLAIHYFIKYLKKHNLTAFIWYRIILAIALFVFM